MLPFVRREHSIVENVFRKTLTTYMLNTFTWAVGALVDGAVIGNFLGVDAVAAYGLIWPLTFVYALVGSILSGGSRNLYTRLAGQGKTKEANHVFTLALLLAVGISAGLVAVTFLLLSPLAGLLGAAGENALLRPLVCRYLAGFVLGLPFDNGAKVLAGYMGMDSDHRRVVLATLAMTITDVVGDLAVVLLFHGGMFLVGLATAVGQLVYFAVLSTHFFRKKRMLRIGLRGVTDVRNKISVIVANGAPAGVTRVANAFCGITVNRILSAAATSGFIAAYSVHKSMASLVGATYLGIADTVWTLSSIYYGEEDKKALDELQRTAFRAGLILTGAAAVVLALFPRFFAGIYVGVSDPDALRLAAQAVRLFALCVPLYMLVYLFDDYLMGLGRLKTSIVYSFFLECGAVVPSVWLMVTLIGGQGAWFATPVTLTLMILAALLYIRRWPVGGSFHARRLLVGGDFGANPEKELSITADTMLEVVGMSRLAGLFCQENGIDKKKANALALCIEELGSNIIEHGFSDGKAHSIDMRILAKEGEIILRIRDDCRPFNLVERYEMASVQDDPTKNIGIRMVMKMSRDVKYLSTMNTNNLIIRI